MKIVANRLKPNTMNFFTATLLFVLIGGCGADRLGMKPSLLPSHISDNPIPIIKTVTVTKHDTIHQQRSIAEIDAYIKDQFKYNNDKYIAPNFNRLTDIISRQTTTLTGFELIIQSMRDRSIRRADSMNRVSQYKDKKYDDLQQKYFKSQKEQELKLQDQINDLKTITNFLLALWALMFIVLIGTLIALKIWWKRITKKSIAHA